MNKLLLLLTSGFIVTASASEITGSQNCITHGGVIESMAATYKTESFVFFAPEVNVCKLNNSIVGVDTLSTKATIAATYLSKLNKKSMSEISVDMAKLPNYSPGANQSSYFCQLLHGQENTSKDAIGEANVCYFSDLSSIDSWTLLYTANNEESQIKQIIQSKILTTQLPYIK